MKGTSSQALSLEHSSLLNTNPFVDDDLSSPINSEQETIAKNLKIGVVVHNDKSDPAMRINTLQKFLELNRRVSVR